MNDVLIRRQRKHEAEQAISDLIKRGYTLVYPLTEHSRDGKTFTTDAYNRRIFERNVYTSCWMAKLRRRVE